MVEAILAIDKNFGFGYDNKMAWEVKEELKHFRNITMNKTLIFGRKTAENIPPLKGRNVLILSNNKKLLPNYINVLPNIQPNIIIGGGKSVLEHSLSIPNYINIVHLSVINKTYNCNVYFDNIYNLLKDFYIDFTNYHTDFTYYKFIRKHHGEHQYLSLMNSIINNGTMKNGRNGLTLSQFKADFKFDLTDGFPLLTTKKMFFRGIVEEFIFFIKGRTNTKELEEKGINIWKGNTTNEFIKSLDLPYAEGIMGPMYGYQWRNFNGDYELDNDNKPIENNNGYDQINKVINQIKNEPNSRRILITSYNPCQTEMGVLYPCHSLMIQFNVDDNFLDMFCYNRSQDLFLGVPYNIASSSLLLTLISNITNKTPRFLYMTMGDVHLYTSHIDSANEQLKNRIPYKFPKLSINNNNIDTLSFDDFVLENYNYHSTIKAKMVV